MIRCTPYEANVTKDHYDLSNAPTPMSGSPGPQQEDWTTRLSVYFRGFMKIEHCKNIENIFGAEDLVVLTVQEYEALLSKKVME